MFQCRDRTLKVMQQNSLLLWWKVYYDEKKVSEKYWFKDIKYYDSQQIFRNHIFQYFKIITIFLNKIIYSYYDDIIEVKSK